MSEHAELQEDKIRTHEPASALPVDPSPIKQCRSSTR